MAIKKIDKLLEEYSTTAAKAVQDLAEVPLANRSGHAMLIETAKQSLPILREEVAALTIPSRLIGAFAFAEGDNGKLREVCDFLRANRGIVIDVGSIWEEIAERVEPSFSPDRGFRVGQHNLFIQAYGEMAREAGFNQVTVPTYAEAVCRTTADVVNHIRSRVRATVGDEFIIRLIRARIVAAVTSGNLDDRRVPVMVTASAAEERPALAGLFLRTNSFFCEPDFSVTKETVTAIFKNSSPTTQAATNHP